MRAKVLRSFNVRPARNYLTVDAQETVEVPHVQDLADVEGQWVWAHKVTHSSDASASASAGWLPKWALQPGSEYCHVLTQMTNLALYEGVKLASGAPVDLENGSCLLPVRSLEQMWVMVDNGVAKDLLKGSTIAVSGDVAADGFDSRDELKELREEVEKLRAWLQQAEQKTHAPSPSSTVASGLRPSGSNDYTTILVDCLPYECTRDQIHDMVQSRMPGSFDFLHLPFDRHNRRARGFAFINFVDASARRKFESIFEGLEICNFLSIESRKKLIVKEAEVQGKNENIRSYLERYASGYVTSHPDWQPVIYLEGARRLVSPTKAWLGDTDVAII
eukprot:TRINITY_DN26911_c0_g2_i1.p1 TRINITY_DN26911_c0_g2~~TRINITY_DN26911_c0_g2_i1.p1  ORF type:complete len:333 (-),score=40.90 TRINITY_DN26911_c0_g2_i1:554-1552(-)